MTRNTPRVEPACTSAVRHVWERWAHGQPSEPPPAGGCSYRRRACAGRVIRPKFRRAHANGRSHRSYRFWPSPQSLDNRTKLVSGLVLPTGQLEGDCRAGVVLPAGQLRPSTRVPLLVGAPARQRLGAERGWGVIHALRSPARGSRSPGARCAGTDGDPSATCPSATTCGRARRSPRCWTNEIT
jgi:hypothetical protein